MRYLKPEFSSLTPEVFAKQAVDLKAKAGPSYFEEWRRGAPPRLLSHDALTEQERDRFLPMIHAFGRMPQLMGIVNVTPDSFSDGGQFNSAQDAVAHAQKLLSEGADLLDIGGESTRPGAKAVTVEEEIARTAQVISALRDAGITATISIDTRKARVAEAALDAGADLVNDVSGFTYDPELAELCADRAVQICVMHSQGLPETMQNDPSYDDVVFDVFDALAAHIDRLERMGISASNIIADPGIGFGKTLEHNIALLRGLGVFHSLGVKVLLGASRKSFIGSVSGENNAARRDPGSIATALAAASQGVQFIRSHDIAGHKQAFAVWAAINGREV